MNNLKIVAGVAAAAIGLATPLTLIWEGMVLTTYQDIVGIPTVCAGDTDPKFARIGAKYTLEDCLRRHDERMAWRLDEISTCVAVPLKAPEWACLLSFSDNVGTGAFCSSTMVRLINQGAPVGLWSDQMIRWNKVTKAGMKIPVAGLTKRRLDEQRICKMTYFGTVTAGVSSTAQW